MNEIKSELAVGKHFNHFYFIFIIYYKVSFIMFTYLFMSQCLKCPKMEK